ncbi:hypothetical protein LTR37_019991 [Vermiconidia calcicola]|uniref:Uncharacterized protein n=1 Tax=Vermiconidia calcicola TaxID=1690605 RepID=A0ACC3ME51_9PEZI|nr:hypothetical protein LTR37_019991 [Vermiconidia calcicola]
MATHRPGAENANSVLCDETGRLIEHSAVPPAAHAQGTYGLWEAAQKPSSKSAEEGSEEHFTASSEPVEHMAPLRQSATQDFASNAQGLSRATRVRTAPAEGYTRPATGPRANTWLRGTKRGRAGTRPSFGGRDTYQYKFEEAPISNSDSSSSSEDEDELPMEKTSQPSLREEQETSDPVEKGQDENKSARRRHAYSRFTIGNDLCKTKGRISRRDGRLKISINETTNSGYVAKALGQSIRNHLDIPRRDKNKRDHADDRKTEADDEDAESIASSLYTTATIPRLNIVIMVIGSRGDIQPFLKIGKILRQDYGHRVRMASHPVFRDFVEEAGLEFFSVGGDPSELMAFMVKNPGLIPSMQTVREGEIGKRRAAMAEMFEGFWRSCIHTTEDEQDQDTDRMGESQPFIADAIIANPPSMAHVHIAEKLGIPLHIMFTFPFSPTTQFPHPLANIKPGKSNVDANYVNFMSYPLVEMMTWQGLGDIVNRFRENTLRLEPVSALWAPGALYRMKVPYTYLWSPALVPKPRDWGPEIDVGGFVFLNLADDFKPPQDLSDFLEAGDPPVYIGFGSIVVDDPDKFTEMIFKATDKAGVRALVNKGWGGFGNSNEDTPKNIFMLDNTPHDWLFPRVKAVVHHGGAGTTAIGLKCGKPTMIVPFFGDQPFWGAMVAEAKAGAHECIPYKKLNAERLAKGIKECLTEEAQENMQKIADSMAKEGDGAENAVKSFHRSLPLAGRHSMRCSLLQDHVAVWQLRKSSLRLSALAAELLQQQGKIKYNDLKLIRHYEWNDFDGPGEPFTGGVAALTDSLYGIGEGFGMVPVRIARHIRKREEHERRKRARQRRRQDRERKKAEKAAAQLGQVNGTPDAAGSERLADKDGSPAVRAQRPTSRREETSMTMASLLSADPTETLPTEVIHDLNWGLKRAGVAFLTMPNDFHVATAQGFHNAPRLWGDATVRKPVKITGFKSGLAAARQELVYGMKDGWTGLVRQPKGDWEDGETLPAKFAGLGTGIGKGVGGFVLKNANAVWAPPAFITKGLFKYIEKKHDGPGSKTFIRKARMIQGERDRDALQNEDNEENKDSSRELQERVYHGWSVYEQLWTEAYKEFGQFGQVRDSWIGKYRMLKEAKHWDANGALENAKTAERAMHIRKDGKDLEKFFAKRRREVSEAQKPRAGAMEQPESLTENPMVLSNGRIADGAGADLHKGREEQNVSNHGTPFPQLAEEDLSESTTVAGAEEEEKRESYKSVAKKRPLDDAELRSRDTHSVTVP